MPHVRFYFFYKDTKYFIGLFFSLILSIKMLFLFCLKSGMVLSCFFIFFMPCVYEKMPMRGQKAMLGCETWKPRVRSKGK